MPISRFASSLVERPVYVTQVWRDIHEVTHEVIDDPEKWDKVWLVYAREINANASWLADRLVVLTGGEVYVVTSRR